MNTTELTATNSFRALLAVALLAGPMTLSAETPSPTTRADAAAAERRVIVSLGPVDAVTGPLAGRIGERAMAVRLPLSVTLHRFRVQMVDAAGQPMAGTSNWSVALFSSATGTTGMDGAGSAEPMARLSATDADLRLPRPYGVRLDPQDSLLIFATLTAADVERGAILRISMEYEPREASMSRLPVQTLTSSPDPKVREHDVAVTDEVVEGRWSLRPTVAGRLVAISGRSLSCAEELVLADSATGRVLWRNRTPAIVPGRVSGQRSDVIRPGVTVEAGVTYELRAIYSDSAEGCGMVAPLAMVFPQ